MTEVERLTQSYQKGETSVREVCQSYLDKISQTNPQINAVVHLNPQVLEQAEHLDQQGPSNRPLFGIPVLIKDNFCVKGLPTTAASKILADFVAPYTATCVQHLVDAGAVILGKTNMDEFGMGSSNESSCFGPVCNPWNLQKVAGGSSGGSAAAVAAKLAPLALGSDTGGSVRQPASFCGVVGIKPTYGSVSRYGLIAFASSLDQAGVFAGSVSEAAQMLDVMMQKDPADATSSPRKIGSLTDRKGNLKGLKIGFPQRFLSQRLEPALKQSFEDLMERLQQEGARVTAIDLPHADFAIATYHILAACEAASNLARYDGIRYGHRASSLSPLNLEELYARSRAEGFGDEVKRRLLLGTFALSADSYESFYLRAAKVRRLIQNDFTKVFGQHDLILSPVTLGGAFAIGSQIHDPVAMYENDRFTTPASLAGLPCLSLPLAHNSEGLPLGLQVIAPAHAEERLVSAALGLEALIRFKGGPIDR